MLGFATVPAAASLGAIVAAWQARRPAAGVAWDDVDVEALGGSA
jgi:hypothetical protein